YWALADTPQPYISMKPAFEGERLTFLGTFPGLVESDEGPRAGPWTEEQVKKATEYLGAFDNNVLPQGLAKAEAGLMILGRHEAAKKALVAAGRPSECVEKMPHIQVAILHSLLEYDQKLDEMLKWNGVPYHEAREQLWEMDKAMRNKPKLRPSD